MASSTRYHLLPDEGRPSTDTIPDPSSSLIDVDNTAYKGVDSRFGFSNLHITLYLRLIAFAFFLAAAIVLGVNSFNRYPYWYDGHDERIPGIVFLSFALARNTLVVFSHFVSSIVKVSISFQVKGMGTSKPRIPGWLKGRMFGILLDLMILVCLLISLPIGVAWTSYSGYNRGLQTGFIVGLVGVPWYFLAIIDGGKPRSIALTTHLIFASHQDGEQPAVPRQVYRDVEAQQPEVTTIGGDDDIENVTV